ncbi:sugar ABC transporter ATP-binding protein [Anaerotruncus colihominis]|uniref:sugar ABC transporter ATP-binding protein n=1 Tax=Anaerotruncus colihominis TaxID=169435 RepID=UPI002942D679|nr:sugar ABC transporter ATP-binding protein [Anaerotruncus colihominis]
MEYKIEMRGICKSFPGVKALDNVSLKLLPGEVMILLGENGAGKSTLMKVLAGVYNADSGEIYYKGKKVDIRSTKDAEACGIYMIYQELNLVPDISVAENIFLGREPRKKGGLMDYKMLYSKTREILAEMNLHIDPRTPVKDLSMAQSQMVEISRALMAKADVVIMDEPTTAITNQETEELFRQIRKLTAAGVSILYISHRLQEVAEIGDRVFVMRDGAYVDIVPAKTTARDDLIKMMVGREIGDLFPKQYSEPGEELLRAEHISRPGVLRDCSFSVRRGEVLGFSGLMGAGRTELMRAIFGADPGVTGDLYIKGTKTRISSPKAAVRHGLAFVTEDRKHTGIIAGMAVDQNITLSSLQNYAPGGFLRHRLEEETAGSYVKELKIKTPTVNTDIASLSGGNQQKALLARWLCTEADVIIMDEPTRGIDVGAKREIYMLINQLTQMGKAVIMVSSDLPEVLGMSDRIMVMSGGAITGELDARKADQVAVMRLATKDVQV